MALGVPFISTPVGGVQELSNAGQCGKIVMNVEECVEAVKECVLQEEEHQNMQKNCMQHVEQFSLEKQIQQIEELIDEVIEEKNRS